MFGRERRKGRRQGRRELAPFLLGLGGLCLFVLPFYKLFFAIDKLPTPADLTAIAGEVLVVETGAPFGHRGKSAAFGRAEAILTLRLANQSPVFYYLADWPKAERLHAALQGPVTLYVWKKPVAPLDAEQLWQVEKDGEIVVAASELIAHLDAAESWKRLPAYGVTFLGVGLLLLGFVFKLEP